MATATTRSSDAPMQVDTRSTRFTAAITAAVLALVLIVARASAPAAGLLAGFQALVFAAGAAWGPSRHPYGMVFASLVAPRIGASTKREPVEPIRFAQLMGALFCALGAVGFLLGWPVVGLAATGFALLAALTRAVFGVCLSRGPYMLFCRMRGRVPACCQNK